MCVCTKCIWSSRCVWCMSLDLVILEQAVSLSLIHKKNEGDKLCPQILTHDSCWGQWELAVLLWKQNFASKTESSRNHATLFTARNLLALLSLPAPPPQFKWRMLTLCTGTFEMLGYYQCAKWAAFDAGDLQKVWWRVRRQCASKYIQGGGDETVERNLETIIKINAIGGHCWTCCTSLDSFDWFPVTHQRGGELCFLWLCPWISEMHVSLHAPRARSKSQRSPLIGLPEIKRCK